MNGRDLAETIVPYDIWNIISQYIMNDDLKALQRLRLTLSQCRNGFFSLKTPLNNQIEIDSLIQFAFYDIDELKKYRCINQRKWSAVISFVMEEDDKCFTQAKVDERFPTNYCGRLKNLFSIVKSGDLKRVQDLSPSFNEIATIRDSRGKTLMHYADMYDHQPVRDYFYTIGKPKNLNPVRCAQGKDEVISYLQKRGNTPVLKFNMLLFAIVHDRLDIVEMLFDNDLTEGRIQSLINRSIDCKRLNILKFILSKNINAGLNNDFHFALQSNNEEIAFYLLNNTKVDVNVIVNGETALIHAARNNMHRMVIELIERGAKASFLTQDKLYAEHMPTCLKLKIYLIIRRYSPYFITTRLHFADFLLKLNDWVVDKNNYREKGDAVELESILSNWSAIRKIKKIDESISLMKQQHQNKICFIRDNIDLCFDAINSYTYHFPEFKIISCKYYWYGEKGSGIYLSYSDNEINDLIYLEKDCPDFAKFFKEVTLDFFMLYLVKKHVIQNESNLFLHKDASQKFIEVDKKSGMVKVNWDVYRQQLEEMKLEPLTNPALVGTVSLSFPAMFNGYQHKIEIAEKERQVFSLYNRTAPS